MRTNSNNMNKLADRTSIQGWVRVLDGFRDHAHHRVPGYLLAVTFLAWLGLSSLPAGAATEKVVRKMMGSRFEITVVHPEPERARAAIEAAYSEIERLEAMISSWQPRSITTAVNQAAGSQPVKVPGELFRLIRRSIKVSQLTDGAFDITYDGFGNLWNFKAENPVPPSPAAVKTALELVGYQHIRLNEDQQTVYLPRVGMRMGFGAIGKGFAANRAVLLLKRLGMTGGVVNAGGDMVLFGMNEQGDPWEVGVSHPRHREHIFATFKLTENAVVTSGDYERFFIHEGTRYAHILNPKTGYPAAFLQSVTVICPDGELADALATAISVMGRERGMALIHRLRGVECMVIDAQGDRFYSEGVKALLIDP